MTNATQDNLIVQGKLSDNERLKAESDFLRGTINQGFR